MTFQMTKTKENWHPGEMSFIDILKRAEPQNHSSEYRAFVEASTPDTWQLARNIQIKVHHMK